MSESHFLRVAFLFQIIILIFRLDIESCYVFSYFRYGWGNCRQWFQKENLTRKFI
jgi:hypothetical protein